MFKSAVSVMIDATMVAGTEIRVVIADDHMLVRNALRAELGRDGSLQTVGECTTTDEVIGLVERTAAHVVLLDVNMPGPSAISVVRQLATRHAEVRVLVTTASNDAETIRVFLRAGAMGYFVKNDDPSEISTAIRTIVSGESWLSPTAHSVLADATLDRANEPLSPREAQVLRLLAAGATNAEIAQTLCIAEGTVKNHISNLYQRLDLHSRAEAAAWAWKHGYVDKNSLPS